MRSARYEDGTELPAMPVVLATGIRIDNVPPPAGTFRLPRQGADDDCCLGNWIGSGFSFAEAFSSGEDAGVGGESATFHVGGASLSDQEIAARSAVSTGADLSPTVANTEYAAVAVVTDALGNRRNVRMEPSDGNSFSNTLGAVFGVDLEPPEVRRRLLRLHDPGAGSGGNRSAELRASVLRDDSAPHLEDLERPAILRAGEEAAFRALLSDNVDLHRARLFFRFSSVGGLLAEELAFAPPDTVGRRFDESPVGAATAEWQSPVVAALERADAGGETGGNAPSGTLREASQLGISVRDAAGNEDGLDEAVSVADASPRSFSVSARGAEEGVAAWELEAAGSQVCAPRSDLPEGTHALFAVGLDADGNALQSVDLFGIQVVGAS